MTSKKVEDQIELFQIWNLNQIKKCYNFFLQNERNMKFNYERGQEFCTMKRPSYCCMVGVPFYKMLPLYYVL